MEWVIAGKLARGRRPGYAGERLESVPQAHVDDWISEARKLGIRSIVCLISEELSCYNTIPGGLVAYYEKSGFEVEHVPVPDHQSPAISGEDLERVWVAYTKLPKPVLVHCSAGIDRTGAAVDLIRRRLIGAGRHSIRGR